MSSENPIELTNADVAPPKAVSLPRRKAPIILASSMAVSLVTAIGIVAGMRLLSAAGDPAERMPASVAVYAATDLTPSRDQVRKLAKFTNPQASVDKLLADMGAGADLKGWMGPSVAVGVWLDKNGQPLVLIGLDSKDDTAATKGLTDVRSKKDIGFVVRDGRVLIAAGGQNAADNQAAAEAAWAEATKTPLAKSQRYTDAREWLSDEQLAVFYVDLTVLNRLMDKLVQRFADEMAKEMAKEMAGATQTGTLIPPLGSTPDSVGQPDPLDMELAGSLIAGVRVEDNGYLVRYRNIGGGQAQGAAVTDALARLGALPATSDVAAVARVSGESGAMVSLMPLLFGGFDTFGGMPDQVDPDPKEVLTAAEFKELDTLMSKPESALSAAEKKRQEELLGKLMGGAMSGEPGHIPSDITSPGDLFDDLTESLGDATIAVAVSGIADTPVFRALIELAKEPEADLKSRLQSDSAEDVKVEVAGRTVTISSASFTTGGGKLADDPFFQRALTGCSDSAQVALYANASKVLPATMRDAIGQVRAIGLCQSVEGGESTGSLRVLMG